MSAKLYTGIFHKLINLEFGLFQKKFYNLFAVSIIYFIFMY